MKVFCGMFKNVLILNLSYFDIPLQTLLKINGKQWFLQCKKNVENRYTKLRFLRDVQKSYDFKFKLFLSFHTNAKFFIQDIQILLIIARHDSYQLPMYASDPHDSNYELDYLLIGP